jgi:UDP-2-acetamido-3-amino-2,3-dideoxy-glucuronate N-acetyltransferase
MVSHIASNPPHEGRWLMVVGAGRWGLNHVRTSEEMGVLGAVVDPSEVSREAARKLTGAPVFESLAAAVNSRSTHSAPALTGAVIATPAPTHYEVARAALLAELDVLVEKPMCDSVADAKALVRYAKARGRVLLIGHLLLYAAPHCRLLQLVRSGHVGKVTRVHARRLNFGTVRVAENVLWSLSPHDVSVALELCFRSGSDGNVEPAAGGARPVQRQRQPIRVSCLGQCVVSGNEGIHDYVELRLVFPGNETVVIEANWLHPVKERGIVVYGTDGCVMLNEANEVGIPDGQLRLFKWDAHMTAGGCVKTQKMENEIPVEEENAKDAAERRELARPITALRRELEHFALCCRERANIVPRTSGLDGLRVTQVLVAASRSLAHNGAWEDVTLAESCDVEEAGKDDGPSVSDMAHGKDKGHERNSDCFVHETATVDEGAHIGPGTRIWHFCHVMSGAVIGSQCSLGQNVYVGGDAIIGDGVRVQNNVSIYDGVELEDNVFIGPSAVFTNVRTPRADFPHGRTEYTRTIVRRGATVGANATIVCGVSVGSRALVGAGAVVTRDVPSHALVVGNPARQTGWVGTRGVPLLRASGSSTAASPEDERWVCPESGEKFDMCNSTLAQRTEG